MGGCNGCLCYLAFFSLLLLLLLFSFLIGLLSNTMSEEATAAALPHKFDKIVPPKKEKKKFPGKFPFVYPCSYKTLWYLLGIIFTCIIQIQTNLNQTNKSKKKEVKKEEFWFCLADKLEMFVVRTLLLQSSNVMDYYYSNGSKNENIRVQCVSVCVRGRSSDHPT